MLEQKINDLVKQFGTPYEMFFKDGNYRGCFFPVYFLFPDLPRFPLPSDNHARNFLYGMAKIKAHMQEVERKDLQTGDIIACEYNGELHVAVYIGKGKIIHVFREHSLQINRIEMLNKGIKGYFRVNI